MEAKAAVDAEDSHGRGLGRAFGEGKPLEAMGSLREEVDEMLIVQVFSGQLHSLFLQSVPRRLHDHLVLLLLLLNDHDYIVSYTSI